MVPSQNDAKKTNENPVCVFWNGPNQHSKHKKKNISFDEKLERKIPTTASTSKAHFQIKFNLVILISFTNLIQMKLRFLILTMNFVIWNCLKNWRAFLGQFDELWVSKHFTPKIQWQPLHESNVLKGIKKHNKISFTTKTPRRQRFVVYE